VEVLVDMKALDFAIITPSYAPDFQRCQLLSWSIERFIAQPITHYIIVDRQDLDLFRQLQKPNTEIITVESVLPSWLVKMPFVKNGWFSFKTLPIRNWLLQQIVKIEVSRQIERDVLAFVDSDVAFIRPFNFQTFVREDRARFFRIPDADNTQMHNRWSQSAAQLLGLPPIDYAGARYVGNAITWRRENVFKMCERVEQVSGRGWIEALCNTWHFSEYTLYGIFVDYILKENSGHYEDPNNLCQEHWEDRPLSEPELQKFFTEITPEQVAVMISAKSGMSIDRYHTLLKNL
jgi:Family of unknown function (DUF6492)